jgi:hypothetical protein
MKRPTMRTAAGAFMSALALAATAVVAHAQQPGAFNQGRDCQTVRTCNFTRSGDVRGCLSSYSCRVCRMVATRCALPGAAGRCEQLRCNWG